MASLSLACPRRSRTTRTGSPCSPTASPSSSTTATRSWCRPGPAPDPGSPTRSSPPPAPTIVPTADEVFAAADLIVKVKEPIPAEYHRFRAGPAAVHLPAPGRRPGADRVPAREEDRLHRLRDGADPGPQAAAAHPDERGRRPVGRAGRRAPPGEPGRRCRHPARRRARHPGGEGHHHRRRGLRHRGREDRPRHAGHRPGLRHQPAAGWPTCPTSSRAGSIWSPRTGPGWPPTSPTPTW